MLGFRHSKPSASVLSTPVQSNSERPSSTPRGGRTPAATTGYAVDDARLMRSVQEGDLTAFEAIYDRHARAVHGLAYRILRDRSAAEDASQEAFLALWRNRHRYAPEHGAARSWLLSIAHNCAIDAIRRQRGQVPQPLQGDYEQQPAPERTQAQVLERLEAAAVTEALHVLPPSQRRVVELAYFGGLTQPEIAAAIKVPLGTVKSRIRLALHKLARELEPATAVPR